MCNLCFYHSSTPSRSLYLVVLTTKSIEECKHETISSPLIEALNIPTYDQFLKGDFPKDYNNKLYTKKEYTEIIKKKQGENHFILESGFLGE